MWANNPEMAKKWSKKEEHLRQETRVKSLIKKMVREKLMKSGALKQGLDENVLLQFLTGDPRAKIDAFYAMQNEGWGFGMDCHQRPQSPRGRKNGFRFFQTAAFNHVTGPMSRLREGSLSSASHP